MQEHSTELPLTTSEMLAAMEAGNTVILQYTNADELRKLLARLNKARQREQASLAKLGIKERLDRISWTVSEKATPKDITLRMIPIGTSAVVTRI